MFFCKESTFTAVKNLSRFIQLPIAACLFPPTAMPRGVHSCLILSRNLIGQRENKRFYVTEIVFADVSFRRRQATAGNTSAFAGYRCNEFGIHNFGRSRHALRARMSRRPRSPPLIKSSVLQATGGERQKYRFSYSLRYHCEDDSE